MIRIKVKEEESERDSLALINPFQILDVTRLSDKRYKLSLNSWDFNLKDFKHHVLSDDGLVELLESLKKWNPVIEKILENKLFGD